MLVRCLNCGKVSEVPTGATIRCRCGAVLAVPPEARERTCPRCGAQIPVNVENCLRCGTAAWAPVRGVKLGTAMARAKLITTAFFLLLAAGAGYGIWRLIPKGGTKPAAATGPGAKPAAGVKPSPGAKPPPKKGPAAPAAPAKPPPRPAAKTPEQKIDVIRKRFGHAVELVETGDPIKREMGIKLMRGLATPAIPFMRKELRGAGPNVRSAIATAMGRIGNVSLVEDLADLMDDPSRRVREAAWKSIACYGRKASAEIQGCLEAPSEHVRAGAVRATEKAELAELRHMTLRRVSDPSAEVRLAVAEAFGGKLWSVTAADVLIDLLQDPDADVAWAAHLSLARRATEIEERLSRALAQLDERAALLCGTALLAAGTRVGLEGLAEKLGGGEELLFAETDAVREGILLRMLGEEARDASFVGVLACLCTDPNARVRRKAAKLLGRVHSEKVFFPMVSLLASTDVVLALSCARKLVGLQGGRDELRGALKSKYRQKAALAGAVLAARKEDFRMEDLLATLSEEGLDACVKGFIAASLGSAPARKVREALTRMASDESARPVARVYAALACCKLGVEGGYFDLLVRELRTSHVKGVEVEQVVGNQLAAANALAELKDERAVQPLVEVMNSSGLRIKAACLEALGRIGGRRATDVLLDNLVGQHPVVARAVLTALAEVGDDAVTPLRKLLRSRDPRMKLGALEAVMEIGAKAALPETLAIARSSSVPVPIRQKAAEVATVLGGRTVVVAGQRPVAPTPSPIFRTKPKLIVVDRPLGHISKELRECKALAEVHEYGDALEALRALLPRARNDVEKVKLKRLEAGYKAGLTLKDMIIDRSADRHPRIYIDFADKPTAAVLLSVDEEELVVRITGGEIPIPWKQLSPYRLAGVASKFVSQDSFDELWALADYCEVVGRDEMAREMRAKAIKVKGR